MFNHIHKIIDAIKERDRLIELLNKLEWSGHHPYPEPFGSITCPCCGMAHISANGVGGVRVSGKHKPDCELNQALVGHKERDEIK